VVTHAKGEVWEKAKNESSCRQPQRALAEGSIEQTGSKRDRNKRSGVVTGAVGTRRQKKGSRGACNRSVKEKRGSDGGGGKKREVQRLSIAAREKVKKKKKILSARENQRG